MRSYPRLGTRTKQHRHRKEKRWINCDCCKSAIAVGDIILLVDIEYTYMRGDDDVAVLCKACAAKPFTVESLIACIRPAQPAVQEPTA